MPASPVTPPAVDQDYLTVKIPKPRMGVSSGILGNLEARGFWLAIGALSMMLWNQHFGPQPTPKPVPTPTPIPGPPNPTPTPTPGPVVPVSEFFRLGQGYKGTIVSSYADSLEAGASQIAAGVDVGTALAAIGTSWSAARTKAFDATISPALEKIAPGGDKTKSAELSNAFRDFAKGVRAP